ncbi:monofunctional biosynthetic peptidoglycan transglycosylase [Sandarakinorhabdus sp.]|uniref:monofunctional biosynthetic peptidoglycan transglycosylase n=1 Tax=Sandarakinorhabdus sp. TaxID=1916663 RepID=UPI00286DD080|nr:monofunctional biosynthetic peptidoglycan transglycosylase [Sandarakinorhabdus sp.]
MAQALSFGLRWLIRLALLAVLLSLLWVAAYKFLPVPMTWPMARDSFAGRHVSQTWVPITAMTKALPRAVIGAEDAQFCAHAGFDLDAIEAAVSANASGRKLRGGSTISQQTAKNAFLWPGRSYVRKGLEAWFTLLIEQIWGKRRIMEVYLNIAEMGPGIYGVEAASQHYFRKSAADLSTREAARIATILPQPIKRDPTELGRKLRRHARAIEKRVRVVRDEGIDVCLKS